MLQPTFQPHHHQASPIGNLQPTISVGNSLLVLISPRQQQNHFHRPMVYNFQPSIMEAITEHIVEKPTAMNNVSRVLDQCPDINLAIAPGHQGYEMQTSRFSDHWQFFLMIDDSASPIISNRLSTRTVMIGICAQEPISANGLVSATPEQFLNPDCQLVVTRQICFNQMEKLTAQGPLQKAELMNDIAIANFDQNVYGDPLVLGDNFFAMSPSLLQKSSVIDNQGNAVSTLATEDSLNVKNTERINSAIESPRRHLKEIITAFESGVTNSLYNGTLASYGDAGTKFSDPQHTMMENVSYALDSADQASVRLNNQDHDQLVGTEYLTLSVILNKYHPRVVPITVPRTAEIDIIPQNITSINNLYSSLVCSVIPSYMNAIGISACGFMYNSYNDAIQVLHIEPTIACNDEELKMKWKSFDFLLRKELYPVLMAAGGHFDLSVMSSLNSTTDCVLNYMDYSPIPMGSIYREETVLGGTLSPLVGLGQNVVHNSHQLNNLINNVSAYTSFNQNRF